MKVLNLQCRHGHGFEGWFESVAAYDDQCARGLLACPCCGDQQVMRLPSAPRLNLGAAKTDLADPQVVEQRVQTLWRQVVEQVLSNTEDVGDRFADEARRIHYGESEARGIRGQVTPDEAQALRDEAIEVFTLPLPAVPKGQLQ